MCNIQAKQFGTGAGALTKIVVVLLSDEKDAVRKREQRDRMDAAEAEYQRQLNIARFRSRMDDPVYRLARNKAKKEEWQRQKDNKEDPSTSSLRVRDLKK